MCRVANQQKNVCEIVDVTGRVWEWGLECLYTQMHFNFSLHVATVSSHYFYQTRAGTLQRTQENITSNPAASEELYLYSALSLRDTRTVHDWRLTQTSYIELTRSLTFNLLKKQSFNPEGECWYPHCLLIDAQAYVWVWIWEVEFFFAVATDFISSLALSFIPSLDTRWIFSISTSAWLQQVSYCSWNRSSSRFILPSAEAYLHF